LFFSKFEEPFFGVTVRLDCTNAYQNAKFTGSSFFLYYLHAALQAANSIEPFRYRIRDGQVLLYEKINASPTINRENGTFGFSYMDYFENFKEFEKYAKIEIEKVRNSTGLDPAGSGENVIHFSSIPWIDFTSLSHARSFSFPDSCPKISFGKVTESGEIKTMPVSIHVHHALIDGHDVGLFIEAFQKQLNR
jgi:chloramphenicol O-acetyltransferase type A